MKTTSLLACMMLLAMGFATHEARPSLTPIDAVLEHKTDVLTLPATPVLGGWYLSIGSCGINGFFSCCCSDGNSYSCILPLYYFGCRPGGPFECTPDLANCEGNPSDCGQCCPGGMC